MTQILDQQLSIQSFDSSVIANTCGKQQSQECPLCAEPSLQILINNALYHKYLDAQYLNYLNHIDNIIDDRISAEIVQYKEMTIFDEEEEFMRRVYSLAEYNNKNKAIVQYYKFHQDHPKLHVKSASSIMQNYYDRKKEFQYKKIKRILKQQQNISITTQKSSQILSDIEEDEKKSHYSNILGDLTQNDSLLNEQTNESLIWKNMCNNIDKALQKKNLSPINFTKKFIFDNPQQKQALQTKNFINYLKNQQEKKEKQEKYKNFIRSNKQSKYNSIEQSQSKYLSGVFNQSNFIKKFSKKQKSKPINSFKGLRPFYDQKIFYNSNHKLNSEIYSKDQKTKQQSNAPSQDNLEFQFYHAQNGFKKNKEIFNQIETFHRKTQNQGKQILKQKIDFGSLDNFKSKTNSKTTEQIYKTATQEMKLKKKSFSYNSLANTNSPKKSSLVNILALKQKDFEIRNRATSQCLKLLKQKNQPFNQLNLKTNLENQIKPERSKPTNNLRTVQSVPKFYQREAPIHSENRTTQTSLKKISIPKEVIQNLKGKSYSSSKLPNGQLQSSTNSKSRSNQQTEKEITKLIVHKKPVNLFIENGFKSKNEMNRMFFAPSSNSINIEKLLNAKLLGKNPPQKKRQHKILI